MKTSYEQVLEFHQKYGHPANATPHIPDAKLRLLRVRLLVEEVAEFAAASGFPISISGETFRPKSEASGRRRKHFVGFHEIAPADSQDDLINIVEAADGLADIDYVTQGAHLTWGFPSAALMAEVHRSNMTKPTEKDEHGKTLKNSPDFSPANIAAVLLEAGWGVE